MLVQHGVNRASNGKMFESVERREWGWGVGLCCGRGEGVEAGGM